MRHIGTLIAAIVIGPLAWILIAFGQDRSAEAFAKAGSGGAFHTGDFVQPLIYLAVAGLLLGLIATLRYSPLGAVLAGAVYTASYVVLLFAPDGELDLFTGDLSVFGHTADPRTPIRTGTTLVIGALLLVAVASVSRWRRWPHRPATPAAPDPLIPETTAFGLPPAGSLLGSGPGAPERSGSASATRQRDGADEPDGADTGRDRDAGTDPDASLSSASPWTLPPREKPADDRTD